MGGYGSGRSGWRPVNDTSLALSLDRHVHDVLADLQRSGGGTRSSVITWSIGGNKIAAINILVVVRGVRDALMVLSYTCTGESMREVLALDWTQTPFGWRPWWRCPRCHRRCKVLYNPDGPRWRCRICYNVTYTSSNESDKRLAYSRIMKVLGTDPGWSTGALIVALRGYDRVKKKVAHDMERARRHPGTPGRPRKR